MTTKRWLEKRQRWEVDFGLDSAGKTRIRHLYKAEAEADDAIDKFGKDLAKSGKWWAQLPEMERKSVELIYLQAKASGFTLQQVWDDHQRWRKDNSQTAVKAMPFQDAVTEHVKRKIAAGKTKDYMDECSALLLRFGEGRLRQNMHEIPMSDLQSWINEQPWGLSSKRTNTSIFSALWQTGKDMGWCSRNICDALEPVGKIGRTVKIYPNDLVLNLMAAVMDSDATQQIIAPTALELFGCMRFEEVTVPPEEGKAFGWHDIDLKHGRVTVRPEIAKVGDQRTIRLQKTAVLWLEVAKEKKNQLPPVNERRLVDQCCELIGLEEWIRDGLRKCCATHLRNVYKNDYEVIKDCGNSVRILLKHYAQLHTTPEESDEFWDVTPKRVAAYRKTKEWEEVKKNGALLAMAKAEAAAKAEAEKATSEAQKAPKANETSKPAR
jgi:hypothetical protein